MSRADSPGAGGERQYITEFTSGAEAAADTGYRDSRAQVARYAHVLHTRPVCSLAVQVPLSAACRGQSLRALCSGQLNGVRAHALCVVLTRALFVRLLLTAAVLPSLTPCLTGLTPPSGVACSQWQQQLSQCKASSE